MDFWRASSVEEQIDVILLAMIQNVAMMLDWLMVLIIKENIQMK